MAASEDFARSTHQLKAEIEPRLQAATRALTGLNLRLSTFIKANPGRCLLGAIASGYVIGRIARRHR